MARSVDWAQTPLGDPWSWPSSLATAVDILLHSRHPMFLWWGEELVQLYNDGYVPSFGVGKHPAAMGQRGPECWQESWPTIGPQIASVMEGGEATWWEDHLVPIFRNGRLEEAYWSYSFSPVRDGDRVGGVLAAVSETTQRVLTARRLDLLRSLAATLPTAVDPQEVQRLLVERLAGAERDVPFALTVGKAGLGPAFGLAPDTAAALCRSLGGLEPAGRRGLDNPVAAGAWPEPVTELYLVPLTGFGREVLVFGLSPRLSFDEPYRDFLHQVVEQLVSALARARVEHERRQLLMQAPVATALLTGPEHTFEIANPLYVEMVGRDVRGKTYLEAFPELRDSPSPAALDHVYQSGEAFTVDEMLLPLSRAGEVTDRFFKFNLQPIRNRQGEVYGMMAVAVDITEQVVARRELERTNSERAELLVAAEAASRAKDEFLAMLGHELRNPLAPILTALELMEHKAGGQLVRERQIIARQAQHLVHLVDDLLDVSRVVQGKIEIARERIALADVVQRAVETSQPLLTEREQQLEVSVPRAGLDVDGDLLRLSQVVGNLLSNAARYSPAGGHIAVSAGREGDDIVLRVRDEGIGIPPEQLPRVFERFFQGPRSSDRSEGGLGLGLALVKSLVELHGGSAWAESEGPGKGSTFGLRLPAARRAEEAAAPRAVATPGAASGRILLVDDNEDAAELLASMLASQGFEVRTAHDGHAALELAASFRPTVAVLDIGLPRMDGYELARRLRERFGSIAPRLIALSGYGKNADLARCEVAGFEQLLVKPISSASLISAIAAHQR